MTKRECLITRGFRKIRVCLHKECLSSAKGAVSPEPGASPQGLNRHAKSAEGALQSSHRIELAGSESRFQRQNFLGCSNPGALPQAGAEHAAPLALHI